MMKAKTSTKQFLVTGFLLGGVAIILGAMGAHALQKHLSAQSIESFKTGVFYQIVHAMLFLFLALFCQNSTKLLRKVIFYMLLTGVLCFSGSIYVLALNKGFEWFDPPTFLVLLTPFGGSVLIAVWFLLLLEVLKWKTND